MGKAEKTAVLTTVLGVAICVGGRLLATWLQLPLWLDSIGTVAVAYLLGPIPGAVAGLAMSTICAMIGCGSYWYGLTAIAIGLVVGVFARRGYLKTFFGTMATGSAAAIAAVVLSTPLNLAFFGGYTDNMWGDGVVDLFARIGLPMWACSAIGQFYLEFLDKIFTLMLLFLALVIVRKMRHKRTARAGVSRGTVALLLVALMVCVPRIAQAQTVSTTNDVDFYSFVQETYSSDNGLPCGEANDIAQTKDGILWIGTYAGLYRYNGHDFSLMSDFDSVKNVNCLYVDEEGRLWIGTNDKGLSMCVEEQLSTVIDTASGLPSDSVRDIVQASDGRYYVGTSDALQVFQLNAGVKMLTSVEEVAYAHSLSADEAGHVAAVTLSGELFVLGDGRVLMSSELSKDAGVGVYTCCLFDDKGKLWVGTSEGVAYRYDISAGSFKEEEKRTFEGLQEINSLFIDSNGLLFGCADNGVGAFVRGGAYEFIRMGQFSNSIDHVAEDYQGNYWFSSSRLGLLKMTRSTFSDLYEMAGIERDVTNTTCLWQNLLYVGTDSGLDIVDLQTGKSMDNDLTKTLEGVRIRCAFVDSRNHLWLCTYGKGLLDVAPNYDVKAYDATDKVFSDRVRTCIQTKDGSIVASSDSSVAIVKDDKVQQVIPYGSEFSSSQVLCFTLADDGTVLCGTDGDGIVAIRDGKEAWRTTVKDGLSSNIVMRIVPASSANGFYVVTSNGLCFMESSGTARLLSAFPYFNNFDVQMGPSGEVLVLSSAGIYVVSEKDLLSDARSLRTDLLDRKFGLDASITANSWNCMDDTGMLYVCTDSGVFRLDTHNYAQAKRLYHMKVSSISLDGVEHRLERGVPFAIAQNTSRMEIYPEIISYTLDDPYVSYQLEGYDAWPTRMRKSELAPISYTNLGPGDYTFKLCILSADGTVLEESVYQLRKEPMIYDNAWFMVYVVVVGGLAIAWFTWYIARSSMQRRLDLQQRELDLAHRQIQMADQTVLSIARAVDAKDENTSQHSRRVSEYSVLLARELGFTEDECENLRKAALLHDIGKIGIPDRILNKPGRLTDQEYAIMKTHVSRGAEILKDFTMIDHVVEGALYHHERYDGRGYVNGIAGEQIPLYGRIISVADAFDAMTQNRVYREKQDLGYVLGELERGKGSQFDPEIATIMLRLIDEGKIDHILNGTEKEEADE